MITITSETHDRRKQKYDKGKLQQRLRRLTGQAITDFGMINEADAMNSVQKSSQPEQS